jgi:hypothetical protein
MLACKGAKWQEPERHPARGRKCRAEGSGRAARRSRIGRQVLLVCLGLSGCMRFGYDLVSEAAQVPDPFGELIPAANAVSAALDAGGDAAYGSLRQRQPFDEPLWDPRSARREQPANLVSSDGGSSPSAPQVCAPSGSEQVVNGFDSPTPGLQARAGVSELRRRRGVLSRFTR